jgi:hypothetical protein
MADASSDRFQDTGEPVATGRALVPLTTTAAARSAGAPVRPDARFVAQLIATAAHAPQTRALRRAAPGDAAVSYSVPMGRAAIADGVVLSQVA